MQYKMGTFRSTETVTGMDTFFFFEFSVIAKAKFLVALTFTHLTAWWGRFRNPEGSKLTGTL